MGISLNICAICLIATTAFAEGAPSKKKSSEASVAKFPDKYVGMFCTRVREDGRDALIYAAMNKGSQHVKACDSCVSWIKPFLSSCKPMKQKVKKIKKGDHAPAEVQLVRKYLDPSVPLIDSLLEAERAYGDANEEIREQRAEMIRMWADILEQYEAKEKTERDYLSNLSEWIRAPFLNDIKRGLKQGTPSKAASVDAVFDE